MSDLSASPNGVRTHTFQSGERSAPDEDCFAITGPFVDEIVAFQRTESSNLLPVGPVIFLRFLLNS